MDTPQDICNKYCKQRLQRLVDDKPCPFQLIECSTEMQGDDLEIKTKCEGFLDGSFKTIIDRVSILTKTGVEIIKEVIKHEKLPTYRDNLFPGGMRIGDTGGGTTPHNPNLPWSPKIGDVTFGQGPWVSTTSINSATFNTKTDTISDNINGETK